MNPSLSQLIGLQPFRSSQLNEEQDMLKNLGFSPEQVNEAMELYPGNVNEAAAYLLDKGMQAQPVEPAPRKDLGIHLTVIVPPVFKKLYEKPNTCDVTFIVGEGKKPIIAHKYILAVYSSVFYTMFYSEAGIAKSVESPVLREDTPEDFENFLQYCYLGAIPWNNLAASLNLYTFADKYMVDGLKEALTKPINQLITKDNAITVYYYTRQPSFSSFRKMAEDFIYNNAKEIFSVPNLFNKIEKSLVIELLNLHLDVSQAVLLERVIECVMHNIPESERTKEKLRELRKKEADLLSMIRLNKLDINGLEAAKQSKLFTKEAIIAVVLANNPR